MSVALQRLAPAIFLIAGAPSLLTAQAPDQTDGDRIALRAVSELGYAFRINGHSPWGADRHYFISELGVQRPLGDRYAVGVVNFVGIDESPHFRWGGKVRLSRVSGRRVDLGLGAIILDNRFAHGFSPVGSASLAVTDVFTLLGQLEVSPADGLRPADKGCYLGATAGSRPGAIATVVAGSIAAILGLAYLLIGPQG